MESYFEEFVKLIKPFQALWNSARVTCIAVGNPRERRSVTTRILLREEELPKGQPYRQVFWLNPRFEFLVAVVDFPKIAAQQIVGSAIDKFAVDMETDSNVDRVLLRWPLPEASGAAQPVRFSGFSWGNPIWLEGLYARNHFGEDRTCLVLTGTGDYIRDVMSDQLFRIVSSKLRLCQPDFDGIGDLFAKLLPGINHASHEQRIGQIVFPLPLDMEQTEEGKLFLRAPKCALEERMQIIFNFRPVGPGTKIQVTHDGARLTADGGTSEWRWEIPWPPGAESGKASLYYAEEEISSIDPRRWIGAGTLRAAVDCYFDPHHKRLEEALLGLDKKNSKKNKASQTFEEATVRLMNLLGVPLVWYGGQWASSARNGAAGLVDKKEKRVVVLAECTVEKPEAKFSALKERAQELAESLAGEAEVLPVVFTQADPPESVFETAYEHGVALMGRDELTSLFEMLSATTTKEDALSFLNKFRSLVKGKYTRLDGT
jgi:hypothetical protein